MGQRAEEEINRQAQSARRDGIEQVQGAVQDGHVLVARDDIDAVRLDPHAIFDLDDRHGRAALEQFHHHALVGRVEVLDYDKSHPAACGHAAEEQFQRLQPSGR